MEIQKVRPEVRMSDFVTNVLKAKVIENDATESPEEEFNPIIEKNSVDVIKIRQLEQKQELLVGLTNVLFKKFEEMHPTKRYSKFEFTDLSWYKNLTSEKKQNS